MKLRQRIARFAVGICLLAFSSIGLAGSVALTWDPPTLNDDGSPLTNLAGYNIFAGCQVSGQYEEQSILNIPPAITALTVDALPNGATCYFVATAYNSEGAESVFSVEAVAAVQSTLELAGPVQNLVVTWAESSGVITIPWTSPPPVGTPIDWSHPWAPYLKAFMYVDGLKIYDAVSGAFGLLETGTVTAAPPGTVDVPGSPPVDLGPGLAFNGTVDITWPRVFTPSKRSTLALGAQYDGDAGNFTTQMFKARNLTGNRANTLLLRANSGTTRRHAYHIKDFVGGGNTSSNNAITSSTHWPPDTVGIYVSNEDSDADTQVALNPNGFVLSEADTGVDESPTMQEFHVGSTSAFDSVFYFGAYFDGIAMPLADMRDFQANPWQVFEPRRVVVFISAGGGVTLVVQDASHGHTAESPTLSQSNVLAVAEALHGHTADGLDLTQANVLAPVDALHGHNAESPTLSQANVLAVAEALHGHTADGLDLTQANVLAPADALHGHNADNVTLSIAGLLEVADAAHAHAVDNIALLQANVLAPADALHGHTADGITLSVADLLQVQEATHGHTADELALLQANVLAPADATHGHIADNVTLSIAGLLEVADAAHAHDVDNIALLQANVLAPADALHGHTADGITLSVADLLQVQDAAHAHTADGLDLTQANVLAPADALHGHIADNVTLSIAGLLQVADALHAHAADNVALSQATTLAIAGALHGHVAESLALTQANVLAPADAVHGHTADSPTLSFTNILAVADSIHAHTAENIELTQAHTLVVSSALHTVISDAVVLRVPGFVNDAKRVFVVESAGRKYVVTKGKQTHVVSKGKRKYTT